MRKHPYHLIDPSPWPIVASMAALLLTVGGVMYMYGYTGGELILFFGIAVVVYSILFILSEIKFFVAFFWAFFHSSLVPTVEIGAIWPPKGIDVLNPWEIPFLNTIILLSSGAANVAFFGVDERALLWSLFSTLFFSITFLAISVGWKQLNTKQSILGELKKKKWLLWFFKLEKKRQRLIVFFILLILFLFFYWFFSQNILFVLLFKFLEFLSINSGCTKKKTAGAAEPEKAGSSSSKADSSSAKGQAGGSSKTDSSSAKGQAGGSSKGDRSNKGKSSTSSKESKRSSTARASNAGKEGKKLTQQTLDRLLHEDHQKKRREDQFLQDQLKKISLDDREAKTIVTPFLEYEKGGSQNQVTRIQQGEGSGDDPSSSSSMHHEIILDEPGAGSTPEELGTRLGQLANQLQRKQFSYFKRDTKKGD